MVTSRQSRIPVPRILDGAGNDFEQQLLRSASADAPSEASLQQIAAALGIAAPSGLPRSDAANEAVIESMRVPEASSPLPSTSGTGNASGGLLSAVAAKGWPWLLALGAAVGAGRILSPSPEAPASLNPQPTTELKKTMLDVPSKQPLMPSRKAESTTVASSEESAASAPSSRKGHGVSHQNTSLSADTERTKPTKPAHSTAKRGGGRAASRARADRNPEKPKRASSLLAEVESLDQVRSSLRLGAATRALRQLETYQQRFPSGQLRLEASVLEARALALAGRNAEAEKLARELLRKPQAVRYRPQLQALLEHAPSTPRSAAEALGSGPRETPQHIDGSNRAARDMRSAR